MRTLPAVLKFLPSEKAQDARNFVQALQYWLGGNAENLENLLLNTARAYTPALKGVDLDVLEPQLFPDVGIWHPLAPSAPLPPCLPVSCSVVACDSKSAAPPRVPVGCPVVACDIESTLVLHSAPGQLHLALKCTCHPSWLPSYLEPLEWAGHMHGRCLLLAAGC